MVGIYGYMGSKFFGMGYYSWKDFVWTGRNERGFEAGIYLSALSICMDGVFRFEMGDGIGRDVKRK